MLGAALAAIFALVGAEKDMIFVIRHSELAIYCELCDYARFFVFNKWFAWLK